MYFTLRALSMHLLSSESWWSMLFEVDTPTSQSCVFLSLYFMFKFNTCEVYFLYKKDACHEKTNRRKSIRQ